MTTIGERIKQRREELGLSQRQVANACPGRVGHAYMSRIEAGTRSPSITALIQIADVLGVSALYLIYGDTDMMCPVCHRGMIFDDE